MPVKHDNYDHKGGNNYGIVVRCPTLVGDRLVYFDHNRAGHGWVIRDFIVGERLDNDHSDLSVADIEADAVHDEPSPWLNVECEKEWGVYLSTRTNAVLRLHERPISTVSPNRPTDRWRKLP
jgi:hypothetical protein